MGLDYRQVREGFGAAVDRYVEAELEQRDAELDAANCRTSKDFEHARECQAATADARDVLDAALVQQARDCWQSGYSEGVDALVRRLAEHGVDAAKVLGKLPRAKYREVRIEDGLVRLVDPSKVA